ncbi:MAG: hypothetical protein HFG02_05155 [Oscillibacter sp.]|nr:hypothetical protein [Oscillibacter sp.]
MIRKRVRKEIDRAVKEIWLTDICREYGQGRFLVEADIQCSFYHHLRQRLDPLFAANSLYAFTEFYVPGLGRRGQKIDLAVFEMDMSLPGPWRDRRTDTAAVIELKYGGGDEWITSDFPKLRGYMDLFGRKCQYYFGAIDLRPAARLNWLDGRSRWAEGCLTELNAGYLDGEMCFEVNSRNGMNPILQQKRACCGCI